MSLEDLDTGLNTGKCKMVIFLLVLHQTSTHWNTSLKNGKTELPNQSQQYEGKTIQHYRTLQMFI